MSWVDRYKTLSRHWWWKATLLVAWLTAVLYLAHWFVEANRFVTLHKVMKTGRLSVITRYSPHCYYTYRDQPMGFEHDLAREFAAELGVELDIITADSWASMIDLLEKGRGAIIAAGAPVSDGNTDRVAFSNGYMEIQPQLIVNRDRKKITGLEQLAGRVVEVSDDADYARPLEHIRRSGIPVDIRLNEGQSTEELIRAVAEGDLEFTVAYSHTALLNRRHYPEALTAAPLGGSQWLAWATAPKAGALRAKINRFLERIMQNGSFDRIYTKYYRNIHEFDYVDLRTFHRRIERRLSRYSPFIKQAARKHGFDWRLIAAQIYQESHLHPWAQSAAGASGLMQLLPNTARSLGVTDIFNPVENINAGVRHLKDLFDQFEEIKGQDRLLVSLAAYNTGIGHVRDAQQLAIRLGLDPNRWTSLARALPLLRFRKYYKDARHGYCRGDEPVEYIRQIQIYHDILRRKGIDDEAVANREEGAARFRP